MNPFTLGDRIHDKKWGGVDCVEGFDETIDASQGGGVLLRSTGLSGMFHWHPLNFLLKAIERGDKVVESRPDAKALTDTAVVKKSAMLRMIAIDQPSEADLREYAALAEEAR